MGLKATPITAPVLSSRITISTTTSINNLDGDMQELLSRQNGLKHFSSPEQDSGWKQSRTTNHGQLTTANLPQLTVIQFNQDNSREDK